MEVTDEEASALAARLAALEIEVEDLRYRIHAQRHSALAWLEQQGYPSLVKGLAEAMRD